MGYRAFGLGASGDNFHSFIRYGPTVSCSVSPIFNERSLENAVKPHFQEDHGP